jgi:hypothetical protein
VLGAAREAFVDGVHTVAWASAGIMLFAAVVALVFLRGLRIGGQATGAPRPSEKVAA